MPFGFFGLRLEPSKTYSQTVTKAFRVSMASFGEEIAAGGRTCVKVKVDDEDHVLCSLTPKSLEQQPLDIVFEVNDEIVFLTTGDNVVHLTGNYLPDEPEHEMDSEEEYSSEEEEDSDVDLSDEEEYTEEDLAKLRALVAAQAEEDDDDEEEDSDFDEDEMMVEDSDEDEESDESEEVVIKSEAGQKRKGGDKAAPVEKKLKGDSAAAVPAAKEQTASPKKTPVAKKAAEQKVPSSAPAKTNAPATPQKQAAKTQPESEQKTKKQKKAEKRAEAQKEQQAKKAEAEAKPQQSPKTQTLAGGLRVEDVKIGNGPVAKKGSRVGVRYIGKLVKGGKVFDKNVQGKPFVFGLGRGEVIKGWDLGVENMKVGGERRLIIPANLAYGARGAPPDIPRNAALEFEVKLMSVK